MSYDIAVHKMYCPNCSGLIHGYGSEDGYIKFSCTRCGYSRVSKKAGRHKLRTDEFFPMGGTFYGEEEEFRPEEDEDDL